MEKIISKDFFLIFQNYHGNMKILVIIFHFLEFKFITV